MRVLFNLIPRNALTIADAVSTQNCSRLLFSPPPAVEAILKSIFQVEAQIWRDFQLTSIPPVRGVTEIHMYAGQDSVEYR
jgi:hypothetical protein